MEAATRPPSINNSTPEPILKLNTCGHEFHAECLISWFVLRKTSCPICRSVYISKEEMGKYDEEAELEMVEMNAEGNPTAASQVTPEVNATNGGSNGRRISNWRYFLEGENVFGRGRARNEGQDVEQQQSGESRAMTRFWRRGI